jgi:triosephosphate isomerase
VIQVRKPIMAGNWKMNCDNVEAQALADGVVARAGQVEDAIVILCPPATALTTVQASIANSNVKLGAQNLFWEPEGAFTGEISAKMLLSCGCKYVIVGHSERRGRFGVVDEADAADLAAIFGDTDATVNRKTRAALAAGLRPIACCGELLSERQAGDTDAVVEAQVRAILDGLDAAGAGRLVIAYEPVWAIGTGRNATPEQAQEVHAMIRGLLAELYGNAVAGQTRIQYGGSAKPANTAELMANPDVDGLLVGGASLKVEDFAAMVKTVA